MSEGSDRESHIEALIAALSGFWDKDPHDVPDWVAQEITFSQMRLLFLLGKHGPAPMSRVAEWLGVGLPAASGTVERVERHGLVAREHRLDDRRVVECHLTDAGRRLIDQISGMRDDAMREMLGVLNDEELAQMERLIGVVIERTRSKAE
jgi:MarR family transcriptional regulator, multiple antibiotic resistance protein MarR